MRRLRFPAPTPPPFADAAARSPERRQTLTPDSEAEIPMPYGLARTHVADRGNGAGSCDYLGKDKFVSILAHELRSQLAPVKAIAELLKGAAVDSATARMMSEVVDRQVSGMARLIDDLLDAACLQNGSVKLQRTAAALSEIVDRSLEIAMPVVAARGHKLVVRVPPESILLEADVIWLSQALQNVIGNAAKYTNPGGLISIGCVREEDDVVITVRDTGIGITRAQLKSIFELYFRAGQVGTHRSVKGLGIGLYVARVLVEAHGGTIRATSPGPDCGSDFTIRLPCKPLAAAVSEIHRSRRPE